MSDCFFVVTGGPGSGKSSLIEALRQAGFGCMPEGGRAIIKDQVAIGGTALPWADRAAFAELMLNWEMRSYREACALPAPILSIAPPHSMVRPMDRSIQIDVCQQAWTWCHAPPKAAGDRIGGAAGACDRQR